MKETGLPGKAEGGGERLSQGWGEKGRTEETADNLLQKEKGTSHHQGLLL